MQDLLCRIFCFSTFFFDMFLKKLSEKKLFIKAFYNDVCCNFFTRAKYSKLILITWLGVSLEKGTIFLMFPSIILSI